MSLPEQLQQSDRPDPLVWKITSVAVIGSFLSQLVLIRPVSPDEIAILRLPMVCEAINLTDVISIRR
jgi:hypothetical protein